jgi:hypothetical protein
MPVLRLAPHYHNYALTEAAAGPIVAAAHELKMRVALFGRDVPEGSLVSNDVVAGLQQQTANRARQLRRVDHLELRLWPRHGGRCSRRELGRR